MAHSNQVREFLITPKGVKLVEAYLGAAGVLTGSARLSQEAKELAERTAAESETARMRMALEHRRAAVEAQIEALRAGFRAETEELSRSLASEQARFDRIAADRVRMASSRRSVGKKETT
jgi:circadian clock protein KaiC